jgi:hypothetical protein
MTGLFVVGKFTDVAGTSFEPSGMRAGFDRDALAESVVLGCGGIAATGSWPRVPSSEDTTTVRPCRRREVDSMFWTVGPEGVELEVGVWLGAEFVVTLAFASAVGKDSALAATVDAAS